MKKQTKVVFGVIGIISVLTGCLPQQQPVTYWRPPPTVDWTKDYLANAEKCTEKASESSTKISFEEYNQCMAPLKKKYLTYNPQKDSAIETAIDFIENARSLAMSYLYEGKISRAEYDFVIKKLAIDLKNAWRNYAVAWDANEEAKATASEERQRVEASRQAAALTNLGAALMEAAKPPPVTRTNCHFLGSNMYCTTQ